MRPTVMIVEPPDHLRRNASPWDEKGVIVLGLVAPETIMRAVFALLAQPDMFLVISFRRHPLLLHPTPIDKQTVLRDISSATWAGGFVYIYSLGILVAEQARTTGNHDGSHNKCRQGRRFL
jgi:hypothetical protein